MISKRKGIVRITDFNGNDLALGKDLILESDISLGISNDFQPLISGGVGGAFSAVASSLNNGVAGFRQQGFQVWRGTQPIELKLSVSLFMETSGRLDVTKPAENLIAYSVPTLDENGWGLTPPGASIVSILGQEAQQFLSQYEFISKGKGYVTISIGSYLNLKKCVIKNVIPTYNLQVDSQGYPISCKLDIDISTLDVANDKMIRELSINQGVI